MTSKIDYSMDLGALEKQTVGAAVNKLLKHAGVTVNEQALKECGMDMGMPMQQEEQERYSLTITSKDRTITVSTTNPEDVLHMMKLGGMEIDSHEVTPMTVGGGGAGSPVPAGGIEIDVPVTDISAMADVLGGDEEHEEEEDEEEEKKEHDVEEAKEPFANSPATTNNSSPRVVGNTEDFGMTGTGEGNDQYGKRRAPGQGDNPMGWEDMEESYKSFKAQKISESKKEKPDFLDVDKDGNKEEPMKKAVKDKEDKEEVKEGLFAESLSLLKKYAGI
jgi:hypothetical protein